MSPPHDLLFSGATELKACVSIGNSAALSVMPYGQLWRDHRRAFWQIFHPGATRQYRDAQRTVLHTFLRKLLVSPENLREHLR